MGTIRSDKDIAMHGRVVAKIHRDSLMILLKGQDPLAHMDPSSGNPLEQHIVQFWACKQDAIVSNAIKNSYHTC
jgi:ribonuclease HII